PRAAALSRARAPHRNGNDGVTFQMRQRRYFQNPDGFNFLERDKSYELEKNHSPWLRSSMRFRSRDCDGDGRTWWFHGRRTWWFHGRDGNARRRHGRHGNARRFHAADGNARRRFHATFDG